MAGRKGETSYHETVFGTIPRSQLIPLEIEGIQRAWNFVLKTIKPKTRITQEFLKEIHEVGFRWLFPAMGGRFRKIDVEVSHHKPPSFYRVPQLMVDFCADLAERLKYLPHINKPLFFTELVSLLAWAQHRFLWIHPFQDYNGRIGRLLTNVILLKLDLPPIELKIDTKRGRIKYMQALQQADAGYLTKLEQMVKQAIEEAVNETNE